MTPFGALARRLAAPTAMTVIAVCAAVAPASAAPAPCPEVDVVFARGTGEPPGIGRVGQAMVSQLTPLLDGRTLSVYGVNYPASINFLHTGDGATDAAVHIGAMATQCPATRVVLGGFSQGAAVVSMLAGVPPAGERIGSIGSAPPLPPATAAKVAAVVVFGNPGARFGTPLSTTGLFAGRAMDLCSQGDPICLQGGRDRSAHSGYELPPYSDAAAAFIAGRL